MIISAIFAFATTNVCNAQSVTFHLYDSNGNPISSAVFQNVAPGTSQTITCTMSSSDHVTVYPSWTVSNLRAGATIKGYWNGPELWNANTGRMWNTWDIVTLQWTLTVPSNNGVASNVIINVIGDNTNLITPVPSPSQTPQPTPTVLSTQTPTPNQASLTFSLFDSNNNQISSIVFQNVAPGTSKTISSTMSSPDHATVYPMWNAVNLPPGATISGYWNGPEVWNANTGRMWNTWDTVTLKWTLTVPVSNSNAANVIVNVVVNGATPAPTTSVTLTPTSLPTVNPTIQPTLTPTINPLPTTQQTITPTETPMPTSNKPFIDQSTVTPIFIFAIAVALIAVSFAMLIIVFRKFPKPQLTIKPTKLRLIGGIVIFVGVLIFSANPQLYLGILAIPLLIISLVVLNMAAVRRKHLLTMILSESLVVVELYFVWLIAQQFIYTSETNNFGTAYGYYVNSLTWIVLPFVITIVGSVVMAFAKKEFKD